jgi:hypothetical protein
MSGLVARSRAVPPENDGVVAATLGPAPILVRLNPGCGVAFFCQADARQEAVVGVVREEEGKERGFAGAPRADFKLYFNYPQAVDESVDKSVETGAGTEFCRFA